MNKKELGIIARLRCRCYWVGVFARDWGQAVPIYIIGTMQNFVEYIVREYMSGVNTGGAETAAFFILGFVYTFFAKLAWEEYADSLPKNKN